MAEGSDQEKTEDPSQQRLQKAREEGQAPSARELTTFAVLMAGGAGLMMMGGHMGASLSEIAKEGLSFRPEIGRDEVMMLDQMASQFLGAGMAIAPFLALIAIAAIAAPLLLRGWIFSPKAFTPDFSRLNPISGLRRVFFSAQGIAELIKSLGKRRC